MKLTCLPKDFYEALNIVQRAINHNNTLPILNNVLLKAENNSLSIQATNLEIHVCTSIPASIEKEGSLTLPAKALISYMSFIQDEAIHLEMDDSLSLHLKSKGANTKMKGLPSDDFPLTPKPIVEQSFHLKTEGLSEALDSVIFSAASNPSRPVLTAILWVKSGGILKFVATDSYRLSEKKILISEEIPDFTCLMPVKTAQEFSKLLALLHKDAVEIALSKGQIQIQLGDTVFVSRLLDGTYPDYEKILPQTFKTEVFVSREDLMMALKKISVLVKENNYNVRLGFLEDKMELKSEEGSLGQAKMELESQQTGENMEVSLNAQFLLELLNHLKAEKIKFTLNDSLSPVKVVSAESTSQDYIHIIMPLKV